MDEQLVKIAKKQLFWTRLLTLLILALLVCLVVIWMRAYPVLTDLAAQADALMTEVQVVVADLDQVAKSLQKVDFSALADNVDVMVRETGDAVTGAMEEMDEALQTIKNLDIQALNDGIAKFNSVVEPLARLFGR
jgi:hypothetical protein